MVSKKKTKSTNEIKVPKCREDISRAILIYGRFKEALEYMIDYLATPISSTLILRGNPQTGKKSLLSRAFDICDVEPVYLNPFHYHDDHAALRKLVDKLGLGTNTRPVIEDLIKGIEKKTCKSKKKVVIVLLYFQEFCRQKQSLLYCLTTLTQHGSNVCLIGVTQSLECTNGLEKRVRSRLNAQFYHLNYPYRNFEEYLEFSSQLLGGHQFETMTTVRGREVPNLAYQQLERQYTLGCYEINLLKKFLISICSWHFETNDLTVCQPDKPVHNLRSHLSLNIERMKALTSVQLDALKFAIFYCEIKKTVEFNFQELYEYASTHTYDQFTKEFQLSMKILGPLNGIFIKMLKPEESLTLKSTFVLNITPEYFRFIIENNADLHSIKTDRFWKGLPKLRKMTQEKTEEVDGFAI